MAELRGIGLAALREGFRQLVAFLAFQVRTQQQIMRHARKTRHTAMTRFSTEKIIPRYEAYYEQVL